MGVCNALIYAGIWPLAIHDLGRWTNLGSSFMVMALCGNAFMPVIYGLIADHKYVVHTFNRRGGSYVWPHTGR